ncbi:hypothetical protein MBAV_003122 [Candidatus Magnetobacterium bavaricum]|uniref:Uncharacterized protein n=1 Tax=Candidatus Magnetobacterium bavaricum TaxID=29290 RepID=A0A0F3GRX1_9BACT|nr:hypothetical protein MBAV_003122 [Candidatus Magnetobacterium bavaricum]
MDVEQIKKRYAAVEPFRDERLRRIVAAAEAMVMGYGGISTISR